MGKRSSASAAAITAAAPPDNIVLRMATVLDSTPLFQFLMPYFTMNPKYGEVDPNAAMLWGISVVAQNQCVVATVGDQIIGSAAYEVHFFPWNPAKRWLNMVWMYVVPERRSGSLANRLDKTMRDIAARNAMPLRSDNIWGIDPERQDDWRRRLGYEYVGGNWAWFPPPKPGANGDGVQH